MGLSEGVSEGVAISLDLIDEQSLFSTFFFPVCALAQGVSTFLFHYTEEYRMVNKKLNDVSLPPLP